MDTRRRRGQAAPTRRLLAEILIERADHLPSPDAALVLAVYRDGMRLSRVAALAAYSDDPTASSVPHLRRRLRRLTLRCVDPLFVFVVLNRSTLPPTMRRVATACVLHGMSVRGAAIALNLTHHAVRRHRESLLAIFNTSEQPGAAPPLATPAPAPEDVETVEVTR